jgi:hypothetical protein
VLYRALDPFTFEAGDAMGQQRFASGGLYAESYGVKSLVNQFVDGAAQEGLPLVLGGDQETISRRIAGGTQACSEPYKTDFVQQNCCCGARAATKKEYHRAAVTRMFTAQEIIDVGREVVLLMTAQTQFVEFMLDGQNRAGADEQIG